MSYIVELSNPLVQIVSSCHDATLHARAQATSAQRSALQAQTEQVRTRLCICHTQTRSGFKEHFQTFRQNGLSQLGRLSQKDREPIAKWLPSQHNTRLLYRRRHPCCVQTDGRFRSVETTFDRVWSSTADRHFDPLSQHLRCSSDVFTPSTSSHGCDTWFWQRHQGCDRGNIRYPPTC